MWGVNEFCEPNHFVVGFRSKIETWQGSGVDDTAMNAIELICSSGKRIRSSEGIWGSWGNESYCPSGLKVVGFSYLIDDSNSGSLF